MRKIIFCIFTAVLISISAFAQDVITLRSGEHMKARITEIGISEVKYHPWEEAEGAVSTIPKSSILQIRYENGGIATFEPEAGAPHLPANGEVTSNGLVSALSSSALFMQGQVDAKRYYAGYKKANLGAFLSGLLLGPVIGLVPTVAMRNTPPKEESLGYPDIDLMRNAEYAKGYVQEAKNKKRNQTLEKYVLGAGASIVVYVVLMVIYALGTITFSE